MRGSLLNMAEKWLYNAVLWLGLISTVSHLVDEAINARNNPWVQFRVIAYIPFMFFLYASAMTDESYRRWCELSWVWLPFDVEEDEDEEDETEGEEEERENEEEDEDETDDDDDGESDDSEEEDDRYAFLAHPCIPRLPLVDVHLTECF
ncbi:hypothetical protein BJY01DRAFT_216276 [Aspergillus pseudoustus]|uniref:Uncharacterized protein n=1 Tax=Aspergillus pseudoustus TaxID=1810923 RepID=A0ABR4JRT6_9EURO